VSAQRGGAELNKPFITCEKKVHLGGGGGERQKQGEAGSGVYSQCSLPKLERERGNLNGHDSILGGGRAVPS